MPVNGPPRVIVDAERLLVLHDGRVLIRLDPVNGSKRWSDPAGDRGPERPARGDRLRRAPRLLREPADAPGAVDRRRIRRSGRRHLIGPENAHWSIALSERCVVAYPSLSNLSEEEMESMPVVFRRQETGALVQRFVFPATIADVSLRLDARGALVATSRALWALTRRDAGSDPDRPRFPEGGQPTFSPGTREDLDFILRCAARRPRRRRGRSTRRRRRSPRERHEHESIPSRWRPTTWPPWSGSRTRSPSSRPRWAR